MEEVQQINFETFKTFPLSHRQEFIEKLTDEDFIKLKYDWSFWGRTSQQEPKELGQNEKFIWLILAGRGFGKTRSLVEWVIKKIRYEDYKYISIVGAASDEVRTIMIEGESGLLECSPPDFMPDYKPSKKQIVWPNGAVGTIFYGTEPEKSRGAQSDLIWVDELAKFRYGQETIDNLLLGLRLGKNPLIAISTTPKPTKVIKELARRQDCLVIKGSTYDNISNLAKPFIQTIITKYKGTRLGRQEIEAEILDDNPNALWKREWLDRDRESRKVDCFKLIVAIDPPGTEPTEEKEATECGLVVVGIGKALPGMQWQKENHFYVFDDLSLQASPTGWAKEAIGGNNKYRGDGLVAEKNFGGVMVKSTIKNVDSKVTVHEVHASRGKYVRAEPVSALYEQGRVHHIGTFSELEDELCEWEPGNKSPNRLDALVWGVTFLAGNTIYSPAPNVQKHNATQFKSVVRNLPS